MAVSEQQIRDLFAPLREALERLEDLLVNTLTSEAYWRRRAEQAEEALEETNGPADPEERPEPLAPIDEFNEILTATGEPPTTVEELERHGIRLDRARTLAEVWASRLAPRPVANMPVIDGEPYHLSGADEHDRRL